MKRINSIDFVRGFAMIVMALDHVREMIHINSVTQDPTNLQTTSTILFFTRWITYLCAPIFVFLAGTSVYLTVKKDGIVTSKNFLLKRGIYLILLEVTVINFAFFFDISFRTFLFEVIATIGFGFIILSLLLNLSPRVMAIIGLAIISLHNLAPLIPLEETSVFKTILMPFFSPGAFSVSGKIFIIGYPPIPWLGIMLVGFASGTLFELNEEARKKIFTKIGLYALLLFIIVRFINIYGDSFPWTVQKNNVYTFLSFVNVTKYPPSFVFCLLTLGLFFLILAYAESAKGWGMNILLVYGKVPLFYFVVHFFLVHVIMLVIMLLQGFHWDELDFAFGSFGRPKNSESGLPLGTVYVIWIGVVASLYKPCLWFGIYKSTCKSWWLKYL